MDRRRKDRDWIVADQVGLEEEVRKKVSEGAILAVLMDLRDELKDLNRKLRTVSRKIPPRKVTK